MPPTATLTPDSPRKLPACLAPPLTGEALARYRRLVDGVPPKTELRDALDALLACVEPWWELPESKASGRVEPLRFSHRAAGGERVDTAVPVVPLEEGILARLWYVIPWERELQAMKPVLDAVQAAEAQANGAALERWRVAVRAALVAAEFTPEEAAGLNGQPRRMLRTLLAALGRFGDAAEPFVDPLIAVFAPGHDRAGLTALGDRMRAVEAKLTDVLNGVAPAPVTKPPLYATELRDAAAHLWWLAMELCLEREPLTNDRLQG